MALEWYSRAEYERVCRQRDAERAARAREEARALALEAELVRVRAEAEQVRVFYEEREAKLKARIGGEMLERERLESEIARLGFVIAGLSMDCARFVSERNEERGKVAVARRDLDSALTAIEELLVGRA